MANKVFAQLNYSLTSSVNTYEPVVGTTINGLNTDDGISTILPIGFPFEYNGVNYTQVKVCANGYITFNTTATNGEYNNDLANSTSRPLIAPFWDDLNGSLGGVRYTTTGIAGQNVFQIEWYNMSWYYNATSTTISFTLKLFQSDNHIEFCYTQLPDSPTSSNGFGASIGLAGQNTGDFLSLSDAGSSPTISSNIETNTIITRPQNGQIYAFHPSNCIRPTITNVTNISSNSATINYNSTNLGSTFQYYISTYDLINPIIVNQGITTNLQAITTNLNPATRYNFYVRQICAPGDTSSYTSTQFSTLCETPNIVDTGIIYTTPYLEKWYQFTPTQFGMYRITTANLGNTCNTVIWLYETCNPLAVSSAEAGAFSYNDDNTAYGIYADATIALNAGSTYLIRIGDRNESCNETVQFKLTYEGQIRGCTDPNSCNYNPLATENDGSCIPFGHPNCTGPDLEFWENEMRNTIQLDVINADQCSVSERCVSGYGQRNIMRFSTAISNIGTADYFIGDPSTAPPGQFTTNNCHGHAHYKGYAKYSLYDMAGNLIPSSFKNGFCVLDLFSMGGLQKFSCGNMGISVGCGDRYSSGLSCQWIDLTDVPAGSYRFIVDVNWDHSPDQTGKYEPNYVNNRGWVCISFQRDASNNIINFQTNTNCGGIVDCEGVTNGFAVADCEGNCRGTAKKGDIDQNGIRDINDVNEYTLGIANGNIAATKCNDLYFDNRISVFDAALLDHCNKHGNDPTRELDICDFPQGIKNINQNVTFTLKNHRASAHYFDLALTSNITQILAYQIEISGATISAVYNISSNANNTPVYVNDGNKIVILHDAALLTNTTQTDMLRIVYSSLSGTDICITAAEAVNTSYEMPNSTLDVCLPNNEVYTGISNYILNYNMNIQPNPGNGILSLNIQFAEKQSGNIEILNSEGKLCATIPFNQKQNFVQTVDISTLKAGVYYIKTITEKGIGINKYIKL